MSYDSKGLKVIQEVLFTTKGILDGFVSRWDGSKGGVENVSLVNTSVGKGKERAGEGVKRRISEIS